jgi:hypothetical protein
MIVQREIYETQINEFGVPHCVVIGYEEVDIPDQVEDDSPEARIAKLEEELNKLKEQL